MRGADRARPRRIARQGGAELGQRHGERVGTEPVFVGRQLERTEAAGIVQQEMPAVGERHAGPDPLLAEHPRAVEQPVERLVPVDDQSAGHAEANAEGRAVIGIEEHELAPPPRLGEHVADQRTLQPARRGPAPSVAGVDHPDLVDRAPQRLLGQGAVQLDFQDLGHRPDGTGPRTVLPNMVGKCHPKNHNGPSCSPKSSRPACAPVVPPASSPAPTTSSGTTMPTGTTSPSTS